MNIVIFLKNKMFFICTALLFLFTSKEALALDPAVSLKDYQLSLNDITSGLPHNTIQTLLQSKNGYIWIGTPSGLVRFDGVHFKLFNSINTPTLKNDNIISLHEDHDEALWIGTDGGGLYSYKNGKWKNYTRKEGLSNNHINSITSDWQSTLWIGTNYGLNSLNNNGIKQYTTEDGLYDNIITALTIDLQGNLWVGTLRGSLAQFYKKVIRVFDYDDGLLNSSIISLKVDHVGTVWIGTFGGLYYFKEENGNIIRVQGTNYTPVTSILEDEQHSLWIGTMADGLKRFYKTKIDNYNSESGFPDDFIHSMINDLNGNIWIGTDTRGLIQLKETKIKNITKSSGLPENVISTVLTDHSGSLWAGTRNKGLCKIVGNKVVKIFNKKSGLSGNRIRSLYEDPAGSLWIGTEGGNLNKLDNGVITNFTSQLDLQSNRITDILADNSGNLWIGTDNGLYNFIDKKTTYFNVENGFSNAHIRKLMISRKNILHVGTKDGIYQKSGSTFKKLAISGEPDIDITSIYEDNHGILWIGTNGKGLYKWPASNKKSCTIKNGLPDNYIFSITEDNFGNLWMSSYKGVFKVDRKSLTNYFDSKISHLKPLHIDQANGMAGSHCSNDGQPSFCKSVSGKFYYPTNMGISVINPDDFIKLNPPPPVMIEDILDNNISSINNDKITIPHQNDLIDIRFTAFDYMDPGKIKFRYKLEGYNSDWKYLLPTNERAAFYQNPGPGKYRFLVQASGNNSEWNNESAVVEFEVLSPVYSKTYFYFVLIIVILSISGILIFFKHKKKIKKQTEKYKTLPVDPAKAEDTFQKLQILMENERLFLDPDITLKDFSKKLRVHYNILSRVINEKSGLSYNDFINKYRIEEVKKKLANPEAKNKTILEILYDCGFNSKSVFNTTFKKFTGQTPSQFRKRINKK